MTEDALLIDVSANNTVKLTMAEPGQRPNASQSYPCHTIDDLQGAIDDFLAQQAEVQLIGAGVSACGWEQDGELAMPNDPFRVKRDWLREVLHIRRLNIVNDCVCLAMAVPELRPDETVRICGAEGDDRQPKLLIGASYGLGSALIVADDLNGTTVLPNEGGHSDLPAITARETAVLEVMKAKFGLVSRERAVSLQGLPEIWRCLGVLDGLNQRDVTPEEIVALAGTGDLRARETLALCTGWLAATASDAVLMTGARGGVYLAGSLMALLRDDLDTALFEQRFLAKGRLQPYVADIPVHVITAPEPEMIGLSTLFE
ncbi:MAG: glucokinase [Asticcacaulis sp.]|nr:glucokinase [Asticcacaulis sp.]